MNLATPENDHQAEQAAAVRVSFGQRDDDSMPLSWAERGLTWLKTNKPRVFADMLLAVLEVER